jgi:hypothetical protein
MANEPGEEKIKRRVTKSRFAKDVRAAVPELRAMFNVALPFSTRSREAEMELERLRNKGLSAQQAENRVL